MKTLGLAALWHEENGQDLIEYSLLLAFLALTCVAVLTSVSGAVNNVFSTTAVRVDSVASGVS